MWAILHDNLLAGIAIVTALCGLVGAWLKLRPRRVIGWLSAVKEREMLLAMLEQEKEWGLFWKAKADQCLEQLKDGRR